MAPDPSARILSFYSRSERERALLVFFKGLVRYARLRAHRLRLFERLQTQFPSLVTFPHSAAFSTSAIFERSPYVTCLRQLPFDRAHALPKHTLSPVPRFSLGTTRPTDRRCSLC